MDQPTPADVLAAARRALDRACEHDAPPKVIARYENEVERVERWIADGAPTPPRYRTDFDPLTERAWLYSFAREAKALEDEGEDLHELADPDEPARVLVDPDEPAAPSLPLLLPASDALRDLWAEILAERWRLRGPKKGDPYDESVALDRLAEQWFAGEGLKPAEAKAKAKRALVRMGLRAAAKRMYEPWTGRIGSGSGSGQVEDVVPGDAGVGALQWLAQEARRRARAELRTKTTAETRENPSEEIAREIAETMAHGSDSLDDANARRRRAAQKLDAIRGRQRRLESRETVDALLDYLDAHRECGYDEAVRAVAEQTGRDPESVDRAIKRIGEREKERTE